MLGRARFSVETVVRTLIDILSEMQSYETVLQRMTLSDLHFKRITLAAVFFKFIF